MQVTETTNEGLKRTLQITVGGDVIGAQFDERLDEIKGQVQIKGFRPGKVPESHIRKLYGRSLMAEVLQKLVEETSSKALEERDERPALQPEIKLPEDEADVEKVMSGGGDLSYTMSFEILPRFEIADVATFKLEREVADVEDSAVEDGINDLATRNTTFEADEAAVAEDGDRVKINFDGKIDGEPFEGGTGEDLFVVLGQGGFVPGFEDGMQGAKAGEQRTIEATFPDEYHAEALRGKPATFDVQVIEVAKPVKPAIDDEFAKGLGAEDLSKLREMVRGQIANEFTQISRNKVKRDLLDALDKAHTFELPPSLVENEFEGMWKQLQQQMEQAGRSFEADNKDEGEMQAEYQRLAERRVRLGLLIGEIGDKNEITVTEDELRRAVMEQARQYPGQERVVFEYFQNNPNAVTELRAPIFEDKVVDFLLELADVTEKKVSREELLKPRDDDDEASDVAA
ncbi:MAG: trigger factor [Pseudomonadota bacterium]